LPPNPDLQLSGSRRFPTQCEAIGEYDKKWKNGTILKYYLFDKAYSPELGGTADSIAQVETGFKIWSDVGIGVMFQRVLKPEDAIIKVGFKQGDGSWSYLGTDVLKYESEGRTMNLGWSSLRTVLHEIGHTLGFSHEHQNPKAGIVWNEEAVYRYYSGPPNNWSREKTFHNIIRKIPSEQVLGSDWDKDSIMHYSFEEGLILEPREFRDQCLSRRGGLSEMDKLWIKRFYPPVLPPQESLITETECTPLGETVSKILKRIEYKSIGEVHGIGSAEGIRFIPSCDGIYDEESVLHEEYMPEHVLKIIQPGRDGRSQVSNTQDSQYRAHGSLEVEFSNGREWKVSGVLISPYHVLTAAHNIYSHDNEGWAVKASFIPAREKKFMPYGRAEAVHLLSTKSWVEGKDPKNDFALLVLGEPLGDKTGWYGLASSTNNQALERRLLGLRLHVTGYPDDKGGTEMWTMDHSQFQRILPAHLTYYMDTYFGQSGGGVWTRTAESKGRYILGVHAYGGKEGENVATRITDGKFDRLVEWVSRYQPKHSSFLKYRRRVAVDFADLEGNHGLGICYQNGEGVEYDYREAVKWFEAAASRGHLESQVALGLLYFEGKSMFERGRTVSFLPKDYSLAKKWYERAAYQGSSEAQHKMGWIYSEVDELKDQVRAVEWYRIAAVHGLAKSQSNLALMYHKGKGVPQDYIQARKWYKKAIDQNFLLAMVHLGDLCLEEGIIEKKQGAELEDDVESRVRKTRKYFKCRDRAIEWYKKAADQDYWYGRVKLADMYIEKGDFPYGNPEGKKLRSQAFDLYVRVVEKHPATSFIIKLGSMYEQGKGTRKSYKKAFEIYRRIQYSKEGMFRIGNLYREGQGIFFIRNRKLAFEWFQKAAKKDHIESQKLLADMYISGEGVKRDRKEAEKWYERATKGGSKSAEEALDWHFYGGEEREMEWRRQRYKEELSSYRPPTPVINVLGGIRGW